MKKLTEGSKMFLSVMAVFVVYAVVFILFEDYDRKKLEVESADEKSPLEQFIDSKPVDLDNLPNQLDLFDVDSL